MNLPGNVATFSTTLSQVGEEILIQVIVHFKDRTSASLERKFCEATQRDRLNQFSLIDEDQFALELVRTLAARHWWATLPRRIWRTLFPVKKTLQKRIKL